MDWTIILDFVAQAGFALAPIIATVVMLIVGTLFYRLTGLLPGFVRAYVEKAYRDREAMFRDAITKAITNGVTTAVNRGKRGRDVLQEAVDHAMRTNPDAVQHFMATSGMNRDTLGVMAERAAVDLGIKLEAGAVIAGTGEAS